MSLTIWQGELIRADQNTENATDLFRGVFLCLGFFWRLKALPRRDGLLIQGFVFGGGFAPAEVLTHGFDSHLMKDV
ncbi:MAG: hypothetical protein P1V97_36370, partial [Planctomycetota bacterium]|nr:hypothetical protein [Planctomycetota bacterium]